MILHILHECTIDGETVRHRAPIDYSEVRLNSGAVRLEGRRCDGSRIEVHGRWTSRALVTSASGIPIGDPDGYERTMYEAGTGAEYISRCHGPWEILIEFPDQVEPEPEQDALFGGAA